MTKQNAKSFSFEVIAKDRKSRARAGEIVTPHGIVQTPSFVAVGTKGSVRSLAPQDLKDTKTQILFGNTYHLHLQPGEDIVRKFGGLGKFIGWNGPIITDSGGFQVFSLGKVKGVLSKVIPPASAPSTGSVRAVGIPSSFATPSEEELPRLVKISEDGVEFRSHVDGSKHTFTPEISIKIQKKLGADIILAFDECAPHPSTEKYTKEAMIRTHKWLDRCIEEYNNNKPTFLSQALYGIIQGGIYKDLREESAKFVSEKSTFGIAIGGVSVGESKKEMRDVLRWVIPFLPEEKPRHLLGIGEIDDIFAAVEAGMDTFDCVIPTRFGRYGIVFVSPPEGNLKNKFRIDIKKSIFAKDKGPLDKNCKCYVCGNFTRGYINHLFRANELLAYRLASFHNLYFLNNLVANIRDAISEDRFYQLRKDWTG